jgi:hypothetical protein
MCLQELLFLLPVQIIGSSDGATLHIVTNPEGFSQFNDATGWDTSTAYWTDGSWVYYSRETPPNYSQP